MVILLFIAHYVRSVHQNQLVYNELAMASDTRAQVSNWIVASKVYAMGVMQTVLKIHICSNAIIKLTYIYVNKEW